MRVAVTGTTGRVGASLAKHLAARHEVIPLPRAIFDLANPCQMKTVLESLECDVLLNPAGITSLEACEDDPQLAWRANAGAPAELAEWAAGRGVKLIHFSTDYVFGGETPGLKTEDDPARPLSRYGESKLAGEEAVLAHLGHLVLRVSWVFGPEKPSFVDSAIHRALRQEPLAAIADKFSLPTSTGDLAEWVGDLLDSGASGLLHACHSGEPVSWHGMAEVVVDELVRLGRLATAPPVEATLLENTTAFRAPRPRHTAMSNARLSHQLGKPLRPWQDALRAYVRESR